MPQDFVRVAQTGDVPPGGMKQVQVGEEEILIVNVEGSYFAVSDICTHAYASLSEGDLTGEEVQCPLHGGTFNVKSGEVLSPPASDNLTVYPVRVDGDDILVGLP
jgi:3-phenylpropionate/trans-cinnamate dioxygenase ferredoxin subunit